MPETNVPRNRLTQLLTSPELRGGKMLQVEWPRLTNKKVRNRETGEMEVVEPTGTIITRRLILRQNWDTPTPSGSFIPAGGIMFNVESEERARQIRSTHKLYLFLSLEGLTHPHGEPDHPVNVPLDRVTKITDTKDNIVYQVVEPRNNF